MSKRKVAVCDADDVYRSRFVAYLMEHRREELEIHEFSKPQMLCETIKETGEAAFELLILGEGFEKLEQTAAERKIPAILLTEEPPVCVAETDEYEKTTKTVCAHVFKYQPMEVILREMYVQTGGRRQGGFRGKPYGEPEVIGIYSPIKHEMQAAFSLVFATVIAKERKTLYINLMEHSAYPELMGFSGGCDLSDLIVRVRKKRLLPEIFRRSIYTCGDISCLPPFTNPEHLPEVLPEDFEALLAFIREHTEFQTVFLDFGQGMRQFTKVLQMCSSIYCPMRSGYYYECCKESFLRYLETDAAREWVERIHFVELPFSARAVRAGENIAEQIVWSGFGDYVRAYLTGGMGEDGR